MPRRRRSRGFFPSTTNPMLNHWKRDGSCRVIGSDSRRRPGPGPARPDRAWFFCLRRNSRDENARDIVCQAGNNGWRVWGVVGGGGRGDSVRFSRRCVMLRGQQSPPSYSHPSGSVGIPLMRRLFASRFGARSSKSLAGGRSPGTPSQVGRERMWSCCRCRIPRSGFFQHARRLLCSPMLGVRAAVWEEKVSSEK